jgi:gamma-glutamyltranspeptidase/glutathione hydrolase
MPLPSSGGLILAETTGILSRLDWNRLPAGSPLKYHLMIEAWRQAYADRFHLGDPERLPWNPSDLLDPEWLSKRAASLEKDHAGRSEAVHPYEGAVRAESMETTHLSVADAEGNLVAMTITLNGSFGSGLVVAGGGFFLNNEMDDFATVPGQPNLYGLIQGEENAVGPGRRMLSSMSPTLLWNKDREYAFGSPGGSRIPTTVFQVLAGIVSDGLDLDQAIRRGRIHHQWLPDLVQAEGERLEEDALSDLKKDFGHEIETVESMGEVHGVGWDGTTFEAAADIRGPGSAGVVSDRAGTEMSGNAANGPVFGETMAQ